MQGILMTRVLALYHRSESTYVLGETERINIASGLTLTRILVFLLILEAMAKAICAIYVNIAQDS